MDRPELLRLMPENEAARERLKLPCPKCRYPLVGLRPQRCPECGEHHGSVELWSGFLRKTRPGKFIERTLRRGFDDRTLAPLGSELARIEFVGRNRAAPLVALGLAAAVLACAIAALQVPGQPETRGAALFLLLPLSAALGIYGLGQLLQTRFASVDPAAQEVSITERFGGINFKRVARIEESCLLSHERPLVSVFLHERYFCTLFTTSTQFVLCTSKRREDVEAYVEALPEPMREMHISLLRTK